MELLRDILYGEDGMLYQIESGNEDLVSEQDKKNLVYAAKLANEKFKNNTITKEELMVFIDAFDAFVPFQNVDWIRNITVDIHSALTEGVNIPFLDAE